MWSFVCLALSLMKANKVKLIIAVNGVQKICIAWFILHEYFSLCNFYHFDAVNASCNGQPCKK